MACSSINGDMVRIEHLAWTQTAGDGGSTPTNAAGLCGSKRRKNLTVRQAMDEIRRLRLDVNAQKRPARRRLRVKIACKTVLRANLDVPGRATGIINQDRTDRCLIRIRHWQLVEAVTADQFL